MILLTRMDKEVFYLNPLQIEQVLETPDTVVCLVSGRKIVVADKVPDLMNKVLAFHRAIHLAGAETTYLEGNTRRPATPKG